MTSSTSRDNPDEGGQSWRRRSGSTSPQAHTPSFRGRYNSPMSMFSQRAQDGWYRARSVPGPTKKIFEGLHRDIVKIIDRPSNVPNDEDITCEDICFIASYNWVESPKPTMIVPGSPRIWREDIQLPVNISRDAGLSFVYQNAHRFPSYPLLPLFVAADIMESEGHSTVDWGSVDILTDRNNLRKLLAYLDDHDTKDFRIDLQLVGAWTVVLQRWEERTAEEGEAHGYGDTFEQKFTALAPDCEAAAFAGHHRVISYDFGGLKLVLRCEVDACFAMPREPEESSKAESSHVDDLSTALSSLALAPREPPSDNGSASASLQDKFGIKVIRGGSIVPQENLIKVKTRSEQSMKNFNWPNVYPQLLLGQTLTTMVGVHRRGVFFETQKITLNSPDLDEVAAAAQPGLKKLRQLLEEIQNVVMERGREARLSLVSKRGVLQIMESKNGKDLLPNDILSRFDV